MAKRATQPVARIPKDVQTYRTDASRDVGQFLRAPRAVLKTGGIEGFTLPGVRRFLVLDRPGLYWCRPKWGTDDFHQVREGQFLLWQRADRSYGLMLPLVDGDVRAVLKGDGQTLSLHVAGAPEGREAESARVCFVGHGSDPFALIAGAMRAVRLELDTFRLRDEKREPAFIDLLGWCTWDAFYSAVDERNVLRGLDSFRKGGVQLGFMILDDGWLDHTKQQLNDFAPNKTKFPRGLKPLIDRAKRDHGLRLFGIWHAFEGYWAGVNPRGPLAERYRVIRTRGNIRPWKPEEVLPLGMVDPGDVHRFFDDFHDHVRRQGVDMVKVDGQSALEVFTAGKLGRSSTMRTWQRALQGSAQTHLEGNLLHCMAHGSDVVYHLLASTVWRNSDDYFPRKPESHGWHIVQNAMNALWAGHVVVPDWDMFWSGHAEGAFHAAARAISGGPVYVSDEPGRQDFDLLRKLSISGGRVLRCRGPAVPTRDRLLTDPMREDVLLKLQNRAGPDESIGLLGLFHCRHDTGPISDAFSPRDVEGLKGRRFAAYLHNAGTIELLDARRKRPIELPALGHELITLSPVLDDWIAPLGLLDKMNGPAAITRYEHADDELRLTLLDGGEVGLWSAARPSSVKVNGESVRPTFDRKTGLLCVAVPTGAPVDIQIRR